MLPRVLETEGMDTVAEALDYDSMDHGDVNRIFAADLLAQNPGEGEYLDVGTGTAQIPLELCRQSPTAHVLAVDVSASMLAVARQNVERAGLTDRVRLEQVDAKRLPYDDGRFVAVMSNSIVHHIPSPSHALAEMWRVAAPGALVFVRDLFRPDDKATLDRLVDTYAAGANRHQRQMLADSLHAALTVDEVRQLVASYSGPEAVQATSDRHWTWAARKP